MRPTKLHSQIASSERIREGGTAMKSTDSRLARLPLWSLKATRLRGLSNILATVALTAVAMSAARGQQAESPQTELWLTANNLAYILTEKGEGEPAKIEVGENAYYSAVSPDGKLVAIASFGLLDDYKNLAGYTEWWPKKNSGSTVTLVRRPTNEVIGRYPVRFRPRFVEFTADGARLIIASLGQFSRNEKKNLSPQIALLDIAAGKLRNAVDLVFWNGNIWHSPSTHRVILGCVGEMFKDKPQYELIAYDTQSGAVERTTLPGDPRDWYDSETNDMRYLTLESGVVAVGADGRLAGRPIKAGDENLFFVRAPVGNRYFLAGRTKDQGQLVVVEAGRAVKTFDFFPPLMYMLSNKEQSSFFLCASKEGIVVDAASLTEQGRFPLPKYYRDVHLDPREKRLYANHPGGKVTVIDLQTRQQVAEFSAGRGGVKFGKLLAVAAAEGMMQTLTQMPYRMSGLPPPASSYAQQLAWPIEIKSIAFSPGGGYVYVYNSLSADITVVETKGHTILTKQPTGRVESESFLWLLPDRTHLISCSAKKLLVFDTEKGKTNLDRDFEKVELEYEPALGLVVAVGDAGTTVYRPMPFEKIKDLAPGKSVIFKPKAQRFLILSEKSVSLYDYKLNLLRAAAVAFGPQRANPNATVVHVVSPASAGGNAADR